MEDFKGKCFSCETKFSISNDTLVPHFTKARKFEWSNFCCTVCGSANKYARFSKGSNLLFVISEN